MEHCVKPLTASVPLDLGSFMKPEAISLQGTKIGSVVETGLPSTLNGVSGVCCVYVCTTYMQESLMLEEEDIRSSLKLELQAIMNCHVGAGNQT